MEYADLDKLLSFAPIMQSIIFFILFLSLYQINHQRHFLFIGFYKFFLTLFFLMTFMFFYKIHKIVAISFYFTIPVTMALIPMFYLYADSLTTPNKSKSASSWVHFIPSLIIALAMLPYWWLTKNQRIDFVSIGFGSIDNQWVTTYITWTYRLGVFVFINLQLIVYLFLFQRLISKHKKRIQQVFAYTENINLKWLFNLFLGFFVFLFVLYSSRFFGIKEDVNNRIVFNIGFILINLYIGIKGVIQPNVYGLIKNEEQIEESINLNKHLYENENSTKEDASKYSTSRLTDDLRSQIKIDLVEYMKKRPYHKLNLNIEDIAEALNTNTRYVSQVINETFEMNFFNFVNKFRIDEAKEILQSKDSERYTIEGVAKMVGFNSKSSFNGAFKKSTGYTPSEYKKNNN